MRLSPTSLARGAARRPWLTVTMWIVGLLVAATVIVLVLPGTLTAQYTFLGNPDSKRGLDLLQQRMHLPQKANEVVIVRSGGTTTASPAFRAYVLGLQRQIAAVGPGVVDSVASAWRGGGKTLVSADGRTAILPIQMAGDLNAAEKNIDRVHAIVHAADGKGGFSTLITGTASINSDFSHTAETDLRRAEGIGVPIALVILLLVFGAVVAAGLPVVLSLVAITAAIALTALVGRTFSVSVFAINMISMMGLATGIDYSLFIISRFREERAKGRDKIDAIAVTGGTASRAVLFSGLTVVVALVALLLVPTNIFASLAIGAMLVVAMAVVAALTLLPAVLSILGDRVNSLKIPYLGKRLLEGRASGRTSWIARVAQRAMRRPAITLVVGVAVLLLFAYPALSMKTGVSGVSTFPNSFQSKQGFAILDKQFSAGQVSPVQIVVDGRVDQPAVQAAIARLKGELAADPAFGPVQTQVAQTGDLALVSVPVNGDSVGSHALNTVRDLRSTLIPRAFDGSGANVYVTGQTAGNLDYIDIVNAYFPWVVALVLSLSFVLLLVAFRSVVIPAKAILMNLLSVGAAYGLVTLVSIKGWGASLLGFQQVPQIEQWVPLFLFAVLFGLSMDYQVFLLSRVKEAWDRTGDNTLAVSEGVGATAGIITGAALIMVAVFAGFASGSLVMFQQVGFGLAVAVLLDATVIRTLLVPAAMKLLGRWNWYLPSWLEWLPHLSIEGAPEPPASAGPAGAPPAPGGPRLEPAPAEERAA
ncbi:MAG TPA: MMPL family transporter [Thermoleophilia bacterium]|nr:MMPL family transporter [Thermoleophilia bacterium]